MGEEGKQGKDGLKVGFDQVQRIVMCMFFVVVIVVVVWCGFQLCFDILKHAQIFFYLKSGVILYYSYWQEFP